MFVSQLWQEFSTLGERRRRKGRMLETETMMSVCWRETDRRLRNVLLRKVEIV